MATKKRIILREPRHRDYAQTFVGELRIVPDAPLEVVIRPYKKNRSIEQNNTYWDWVATIGNDLGYPKDDMHEVLMRKFLKPHSIEIDGEVIEVFSTKRLNTKEMSAYMEHIMRFAAEMDIPLRDPEARAA